MARQKSEFLKGWGKAFEVFKALVDAVLALGGNDADLERILTSKDLRGKIAQLIVGTKRTAIEFLDRTISVMMDLTKTTVQLIADGKYDWVNSNIVKHFSFGTGDGTRTAEVHLLRYNKRMTSDEVIADMDRQGLRPATFLELLWIGIQHSGLQLEFPIVALGTVAEVDGHRDVAYLDRYDRARDLYLYWFGSGWIGYYRFAAVRK
ncbi:MAG: hypothetical protein AAB910_00275 [Patescibacteria group bacterium]